MYEFSDFELSSSRLLVGVVVVLLLSFLARIVRDTGRPPNFPPGPKTLPILGNLHQFPTSNIFLQYAKWGRHYGDIVGLKLGLSNAVVLNSARAVNELLEKRSDIYSGRPLNVIMVELFKNRPTIFLYQNDERMRAWRVALRLIMRPSGLRQILPLHDAAAAYCVRSILELPEDLAKHLKDWALVTPLKTICGVRGAHKDSKRNAHFFHVVETAKEVFDPGIVLLLDTFPFLRHTPAFLAGWKRKIRWIQQERKMYYGWMLDCAKKDLAAGERSTESLMARILREREATSEGFTDDELLEFGGNLLDTALDTTFAGVYSLIKILVAHPEVLERAQAEVDSVCGTQSPPQGGHFNKLPYLTACMWEAWRWRIPTPLALPHRLERDDTIEGHFIPADTVIFQNTWAIMHDPDFYDEPEEFNPNRYLNNPSGTKPGVKDPQSRTPVHIFGSGRRICPGNDYAVQTIMILMAKLLWACDFECKTPVDVSPETGFVGQVITEPAPFEVKIVPRSRARAQAAEEDFRELEHFLV